ncbi:amphi-Trp domain-containing protein [Sphingomonas canadensis]|uniref:Amphi-Trp domain-containing protein n=1 Tax=Sphingomonas canadensis TaxID=1219257 RepID=A0ABW3H408_9SPHN|nr:amphi-Trp domain-containing protein [Sphingomonas canadensis]MCW3835029.1 hypothetical protein [Sphingomonas canadensis]
MAKPPPHGWLANQEVDTTKSAALEELSNVVALLKQHGKIKITQGAEEHVVEPGEQLTYTFRYERLPKGEFAIKVELKWLPGTNDSPIAANAPFKIQGLD